MHFSEGGMFIMRWVFCELDSGEDTFSWRGRCSASPKLILKFHLSGPFCFA